jgi:Na+-transporting NADH:ubiquinone oxidoreductase subunit NqrB
MSKSRKNIKYLYFTLKELTIMMLRKDNPTFHFMKYISKYLFNVFSSCEKN